MYILNEVILRTKTNTEEDTMQHIDPSAHQDHRTTDFTWMQSELI